MLCVVPLPGSKDGGAGHLKYLVCCCQETREWKLDRRKRQLCAPLALVASLVLVSVQSCLLCWWLQMLVLSQMQRRPPLPLLGEAFSLLLRCSILDPSVVVNTLLGTPFPRVCPGHWGSQLCDCVPPCSVCALSSGVQWYFPILLCWCSVGVLCLSTQKVWIPSI